MNCIVTSLLFCFLTSAPLGDSALPLDFGPEEFVQANGVDILVPGYSVPSFVDWNNDGLSDLIIGQGGGSFPPGKVRVYLNVGTEATPLFEDFFYAQSNGVDLAVPASGCMGCFPRVVYWDADDRKDLLLGLSDGTIRIFLNINDDNEPAFDGGSEVQVTLFDLNFTTSIRTGGRPTPDFVDWNNDGIADLIVGALDGKIHVYFNLPDEDPTVPMFWAAQAAGTFVEENGQDLIVPSLRSSPVIFDLDRDGNIDMLTGNTNGQLLFYHNFGSNAEPVFSGYTPVQSNGVPIDLAGSPRSRPSLCFWTDDGYPDVLIGAGDGKVRLYQGIPEICDINLDGDVDFTDFDLFADLWGQAVSSDKGDDQKSIVADFNGDGKIDIDDLILFVENWLKML
jgi:hypothetical protein